MSDYKIEEAVNLFSNAGLEVIRTEGIKVNLVDREKLKKKGKIKDPGTHGDMDLIAFHCKTFFMIEFTDEKNINTKDFDNFKSKIEILLDKEMKKLKEFLIKVRGKYSKNKPLKKLKIDECEIRALYIKPSLRIKDEETLKQRIVDSDSELIRVWGRDVFEYFKIICNTIRKYSKYELFSYFDIDPKYVFEKKDWDSRGKNSDVKKFVEIEKGIYGSPMYSFEMSPFLLLDRAYVLRNEGWRSDSFQRMIMPSKLGNIRNYLLRSKKTQFANNIIISLDPNVNSRKVIKKGKIALPLEFGSLCVIDGQHRLLAYTQDFYGEKDDIIKKLSKNSNLLVTLVVFEGTEKDILKKQTQLFLDINYNQTRIKKDFIYNLKEITAPKSPEAIGNLITKYLTFLENGVFEDKIETKPYEKGKIKRSSIVTWGLVDIVDNSKNFLFPTAEEGIKKKFNKGETSHYVEFCGKKLNNYFKIIKKTVGKGKKWDVWRKSHHMILSTSSIVAFLRLYRHFLISKTSLKEIEDFLKKIKINFNHKKWEYSSSQWGKLEAKMFYSIRKKDSSFGDEEIISKKYRENKKISKKKK